MKSKYVHAFSVNLKRLRKNNGMTQQELGEAIGYSEKAVSKWERGGNFPGIDVLFHLAELFHVPMESLFWTDDELYFLGIDGGGTKTDFLLLDGTGSEIGRHTEKGCNPCDIGIDKTKEILKQGILCVCQTVALSHVVVFAGVAGGGVAEYKTSLQHFLDDLGFRKAYNGSDSENIIASALESEDGVAVIMGTGIAAFTYVDGKRSHTAGWGHLFDQGGSGFNYGRDAIEAALMVEDGRGDDTLLYEMVKQKAGGNFGHLILQVYASSKEYVASFSPLVFEAAEKGDEVAKRIIQRNFSVAADIIRAAVRKLNKMPAKVILAGGMSKIPCTIPMLEQLLSDLDITIQLLQEAPVCGAVKLARAKWLQDEHLQLSVK